MAQEERGTPNHAHVPDRLEAVDIRQGRGGEGACGGGVVKVSSHV